MGLGPFVTFVQPMGWVGETGPILGQGLTGTTAVSLNGTPMSFKVVSDTYLRATVPSSNHRIRHRHYTQRRADQQCAVSGDTVEAG
jgi:hypothetical protein